MSMLKPHTRVLQVAPKTKDANCFVKHNGAYLEIVKINKFSIFLLAIIKRKFYDILLRGNLEDFANMPVSPPCLNGNHASVSWTCLRVKYLFH